MRPRPVLALLLVAALSCAKAPVVSQPSPVPVRRVVLISFDAGADWIVDRLLARGKAPAFAAIAREGANNAAVWIVDPKTSQVKLRPVTVG